MLQLDPSRDPLGISGLAGPVKDGQDTRLSRLSVDIPAAHVGEKRPSSDSLGSPPVKRPAFNFR